MLGRPPAREDRNRPDEERKPCFGLRLNDIGSSSWSVLGAWSPRRSAGGSGESGESGSPVQNGASSSRSTAWSSGGLGEREDEGVAESVL
jgi:hypothetical protein